MTRPLRSDARMKLGPSAAKQRLRVVVDRPDHTPTVGTLIHWPIDPELRVKRGVQLPSMRDTIPKGRRKRSTRAGAKAKVMLSSGAVLSVPPDNVRLLTSEDQQTQT